MKTKKDPRVDLNRAKGLYFAFSLFLITGLAWMALEWKTFETEPYVHNPDVTAEIWEEDIPITIPPEPELPPPPPPIIDEDFEPAADDDDVEETVFDDTETNPDEVIEDVTNTEVLDEDDGPDEVPFLLIEDAPIFPGCESVSKDQRKACFQEQMQKHIRRHFRYPELEQEMGVQGRVYVQFIIQKDGSIGNVRMRGPSENLEKEAARIISKLPDMTPGKQRGTPVKVPFSIPINFQLQ